MHIRPETAADIDAIHSLSEAAFGQPEEARLVDMLRAEGDAALSLVAEEDGHIIGHVLFSPMAAPVRTLGLGPLSVAPDHRKQGIGAALVRHGLAQAQREGWQASFVLGNPAYYSRFGYSVELAKGFTNQFAGPYFMALELAAGALKTPFAVSYAPAFSKL
ncbi:GNAT family N-acetyltransferase [Shimia sp.]|uniref:GNAT family N-acetyltransferase n=1 Tax=Shimia sp. TaxID=1954381 RepID=UPI003BAB9B8F